MSAHGPPGVKATVAPILEVRPRWVEGSEACLRVSVLFKQELWIEALSHFYLSQRKWDLMKTISLGLKRSRASCLHGNEPELQKHVLRCSQG